MSSTILPGVARLPEVVFRSGCLIAVPGAEGRSCLFPARCVTPESCRTLGWDPGSPRKLRMVSRERGVRRRGRGATLRLQPGPGSCGLRAAAGARPGASAWVRALPRGLPAPCLRCFLLSGLRFSCMFGIQGRSNSFPRCHSASDRWRPLPKKILNFQAHQSH